MKMVSLVMPEATLELVANTELGSAMFYSPIPAQPTVQWRFDSDYSFVSEVLADTDPRAQALLWLLSGTGKEFYLIDRTSDYVFGRTRAPVAYDGFGTTTVSQEDGSRIVAILRHHETWQEGRYRSGLYGYSRI